MGKKETRERTEQRIFTEKQWSQLIFKLYRGCCAWCGKENVPVDSHHILSRSRYPSLFVKFHIYNGMTCCSMPAKDGEPSCHTYCDQHQEEVIEWVKSNLPTHYSFISTIMDPENKDKLPSWSLDEAMEQLVQANTAYDINPVARIIPRCHLPPHLFKELVKRESGIIIPDKTIKPTGEIVVP